MGPKIALYITLLGPSVGDLKSAGPYVKNC